MILVVGASGLLGTQICRELTQDGKPIRALVRKSTDPEKQRTLQSLGATLVYGDLKDPSTLDDACRGISTVISTASPPFPPDGRFDRECRRARPVHLIQAAKAAGVQHFIFISFALISIDFALHMSKLASYRALS
jgi:uncharacterized protein YbjT (DUF2867 family)